MAGSDSMAELRGVMIERLAFAEEWLAKSLDRQHTIRKLCEHYGIGHRQAYRYVRAVRRKWSLEARHPQHRERARHGIRGGYKRALAAAWDVRDFATVIRALRALAELDGANEALLFKLTSQDEAVEERVSQVLVKMRPQMSHAAWSELMRALAKIEGIEYDPVMDMTDSELEASLEADCHRASAHIADDSSAPR